MIMRVSSSFRHSLLCLCLLLSFLSCLAQNSLLQETVEGDSECQNVFVSADKFLIMPITNGFQVIEKDRVGELSLHKDTDVFIVTFKKDKTGGLECKKGNAQIKEKIKIVTTDKFTDQPSRKSWPEYKQLSKFLAKFTDVQLKGGKKVLFFGGKVEIAVAQYENPGTGVTYAAHALWNFVKTLSKTVLFLNKDVGNVYIIGALTDDVETTQGLIKALGKKATKKRSAVLAATLAALNKCKAETSATATSTTTNPKCHPEDFTKALKAK